MGTVTGNSRSGLVRRAGFMGVGLLVLIALAWTVTSVVAQPRVLANYREAYEDARFTREHPTLTRIFITEQAAQAGEIFARDYEALVDSGLVMAPSRSVSVYYSHEKYQSLVNPTEREKFEKERAEREQKQKEADEERLKEIRENERKEADATDKQ
jgi:hypothetical protein